MKLAIDFEDVIEEQGLGPAVVFFQKWLPQDFFERLTLGQWLEICLSAPGGSELEEKAVQEMSAKGVDFVWWNGVWIRAHAERPTLRGLAIIKMQETVSTGDEWDTLLLYLNGEQHAQAFERLVSLPEKTLYHWGAIFSWAPRGSELQRTAFEEMQKIEAAQVANREG